MKIDEDITLNIDIMTASKNISTKIRSGARTYLIRSIIGPMVMALVFFLAAGSLDLTRAWFFFILFFTYSFTSSLVFYRLKPELMYHRNNWKKDAKKWDRILMPIAVLTGFHLQYLVMGLDMRFGWTMFDPGMIIPGTVLFIVSIMISLWSMYKNTHFETTVRIQKDRDHRVVTDGPYGYVRHPGYIGGILFTFAAPLIIGSVFGLINAGLSTGLFVLRTWKEDNTLHGELPGYREYANRVRYRLLPGIW
jgi:protein-S-isoprenylcysteine O-methyltransferase Ste14